MGYTEGMLRAEALKGKTIIVTGGGTGLGKSMGTYFSELGANLVITSRRMEVLEETANEITSKNATTGSCPPAATKYHLKAAARACSNFSSPSLI